MMSTEKILRDQESKVVISIIGSVLVALSGLILFADKVFTFELINNYGFKKTSTFIWVFSQSLSPMLLLIASIFKPYKTSYLIPIYIYTIQIVWVFNPQIKFVDYFLQLYAIGAAFFYLLLSFIIFKISKMKFRREKEILETQKELKETVEILRNNFISSN